MYAITSSSLIETVTREAGRVFPAETGGILMGYEASHGEHLVLTAVVGPGPNGRHFRHSFVPDHEYQVAKIKDIYTSSRRLETYLGDWHTHPLGSSRLSNTDIATMQRISRFSKARCPKPLMLVVSGGESEWRMTLWRWEATASLGMIREIELRCSDSAV